MRIDPSYESEEDDGETDDKRQGMFRILLNFELILLFIQIS